MYQELLERERNGGGDGPKWRNCRMYVNLVLLANCTTCDKVFDKGGQAWPPEVVFKDSLGMEDTHVT